MKKGYSIHYLYSFRFVIFSIKAYFAALPVTCGASAGASAGRLQVVAAPTDACEERAKPTRAMTQGGGGV